MAGQSTNWYTSIAFALGMRNIRRNLATILVLSATLFSGESATGQSANAVPIASASPILTSYGTIAVNAPVRVCLISSTGTPCSTTGVLLYSDDNLSQQINDPTATNSHGLFSFFINSSQYTLPQLFVIQVTTVPGSTYSYYFLAGLSGGGGGGSPGLPLSSLQYNNAGAFGGSNGDFNGQRSNFFTFGNIEGTTIDTWSCNDTVCIIQAPNTFLAGQLIYINGAENSGDQCIYGESTTVLPDGLSSAQFEIDLPFLCSDGQTGSGGGVFSDFSGFTANGGFYGINLITLGFGVLLRGDALGAPPKDPGITLCATALSGPSCFANDANDKAIALEADGQIDIAATLINLEGALGNNVDTTINLGHNHGSVSIDTDSGIGLSNNSNLSSTNIAIDESGTAPITMAANSILISTLSGAGDGLVLHGIFQSVPVNFSALPGCNGGQEGTLAAVNDSATNTWGSTITGSSGLHVLAYCDGTNWTVFAK